MFPADVTRWLVTGERGTSSLTIVEVLEGLPPRLLIGRYARTHPLDTADFRRCVLLLDAVPRYRARLGEMAAISPTWAALAAAWGELEASLRAEAGEAWPDGQWRAPKTYERIRAILEATDDYRSSQLYRQQAPPEAPGA